MIDAIRYRATQFFQALFTRVSDNEIIQATRVLTPAGRTLFRRQSTQDQRHALAVYRTLRRAGHTNEHLLAAALLHDVGKAIASMPLAYRIAIVLMGCFTPRLLERLGRAEEPVTGQNLPNDWRYPFVIHIHHPEIGARWARKAGCSPLTVNLIHRHQGIVRRERENLTPEEQLLVALQSADNAN